MSNNWFEDFLYGRLTDAYKYFGAHLKKNENGEEGVEFVVYAPQAKRIIDFLSGCIYAIGGSMQKIGVGIYLCTPKNVNVQGKITDDSEKKEKEDYEEIDL